MRGIAQIGRSHMRIRRPVAAAAAVLLVGSGAIVGTATAASAHEKPGHSQGPRPGAGDHGNPGGHRGESRDRWLEAHVTRTVTPEAIAALRDAHKTAREGLRSALESAGDDAALRDAAFAAYRDAEAAALLAFDTATLPADQLAPVSAYRSALIAAEVQLRADLKAAKDTLDASTAQARADLKSALAAATTRDERRAAFEAFKAATEPAREAHKATLKAAHDTVKAAVEAARAALEAAIPAT